MGMASLMDIWLYGYMFIRLEQYCYVYLLCYDNIVMAMAT